MRRVILCSVFTLATAAAQAQNPRPASPENPTVPMAPQSVPVAPPERVAPPAGQGTLSDQLAKQRGTVTPPNVDPGMNVGPSKGTMGRMPVIPPPGSPGGDRSVVPK